MPDDQFQRGVNPLGASFSTVTREPLQAAREQGFVTPVFEPTPMTSDALSRHQERMIQQAYLQAISGEEPDRRTRISGVYHWAKRSLDVSIAFTALLILAPIMLAVALWIRLDSPGPAIFKQNRVGKNGRLFCMYKFRSMTTDAGVRLNGIHKSQSDNRVTAAGRFIRKTSLDELPQLFNVVLGQMSLVGPRPELPEIVLQRYEPWQYRRLAVQQGITGWWQVTGRGKKLLWKHTADDLYYVDRASFWFDIKLLLMTIKAVLSRDGAF